MMAARVRAGLWGAMLVLAGCGFTPVYGPDGAASGLRGQIEAVDPTDRDGFVLVARLEDRLGLPQGAPYILEYDITTDRQGVGITPEGDITRFNVIGRVDYDLKERASGASLARGKVENFTGFSATGSIVGTLSATEDASERLMIILADQLVTELTVTAPDWRP